MDVTLTFTKANIQKGWQDNTCPVHRAVAKALNVPAVNIAASSSAIGYYDKDRRYYPIEVDDFTYLREVMYYADHIIKGYPLDNSASKSPPARKIVAHVDN